MPTKLQTMMAAFSLMAMGVSAAPEQRKAVRSAPRDQIVPGAVRMAEEMNRAAALKGKEEKAIPLSQLIKDGNIVAPRHLMKPER